MLKNRKFEDKQFDSVTGAELLLATAYNKDIVLNITRVQKMLYIIYSYFLAHKNYQIFTEQPKAWPYGPVFPRTRNKVDFQRVHKLTDTNLSEIIKNDDIVNKFSEVVDTYSKYNASQLSAWSHLEGSPWDKTIKQWNFKWGDEIPNKYIIEYFKNYTI